MSKAEIESVDTLRYNFGKLINKSKEMQGILLSIQPKLRTEVVEGFSKFNKDALVYVDDYDTNGPMTPGIAPQEASDRLNIYQTRFDDLWYFIRHYIYVVSTVMTVFFLR